MSEALGPSGQARVADLHLNNNNTHMAGYVIYENNRPVRSVVPFCRDSPVLNCPMLLHSLVLINFMSDRQSGSLAYTARVGVNGASSVRVRYLRADSITSKFGISYASQTVRLPFVARLLRLSR